MDSYAQQMLPGDDTDELTPPTRPLTDPSTGDNVLDASTTANRKAMLNDYLERVRTQRAQASQEAAQNQVGATDFQNQAQTASNRNTAGAIANAMNFTGSIDPSHKVQSALPQYLKEQNAVDANALQAKQGRYEKALGQENQANGDLLTGSDEAGKIQTADNAQTTFDNQQTKFGQDQQQYGEQTNPSSTISQQARALATKMGYTPAPNATYQQVTTSNAAIKDMFDQDMKSKDIALRSQYQNMLKQQGMDFNESKHADTEFDGLTKATDPGAASSRTAFGQDTSKQQAASRIEALSTQAQGQPGGLDARQMREAATALNGLLGGSSGVTQVEEFVPHTILGDVNKIYESISNIPQGLDQQRFVQRMMDTVNSQKSLAQTQAQGFQLSNFASHDNLRQKYPDRFADALAARGFSTDQYNKFRVGQTGATPSAASTPPAFAPGTAHGKYSPGDVVTVAGKNYKVGADGDSLEPQ